MSVNAAMTARKLNKGGPMRDITAAHWLFLA